jgi:hypothetical protein
MVIACWPGDRPIAGYVVPMSTSPIPDHQVPDGVTPDTVDAVGKLTKALETADRARGHLYAFHQLIGEADRRVERSIDMLRAAGHPEWAERLDRELWGRNIHDGRWTFQVVEEFDDGYWSTFRELEAEVRDDLQASRRHLREAKMKERQRTHGEPGHEPQP